jgi:hypothetical protein
MLVSASSRRAGSRLSRALPPPAVRAAAGVVLLASVLSFLVWRAARAPVQGQGSVRRSAAPAPAAAAAATPATLGIVTLPFSEVLSVRDLGRSLAVDVPSGSTTPFILSGVVAGRYRLTLRCPETKRTVERDVALRPGELALFHEHFLPEEKLMESLQ